jgi:hypothetical protein
MRWVRPQENPDRDIMHFLKKETLHNETAGSRTGLQLMCQAL